MNQIEKTDADLFQGLKVVVANFSPIERDRPREPIVGNPLRGRHHVAIPHQVSPREPLPLHVNDDLGDRWHFLSEKPRMRQDGMELEKRETDAKPFGTPRVVITVAFCETANAIFVHAPVVQRRSEDADVRKPHAFQERAILAKQRFAFLAEYIRKYIRENSCKTSPFDRTSFLKET